jgi:putative peptidoglycan lipid II flippase
MLAYLTIPATVGLIVLRVPVVRLIYERMRFTAADTEATAAALLLYSFGLVGYTGVKVLAPAFYALDRPRVPLAASGLAIATNLTVVVALYPSWGFRALALGTALGSLFNAGLLAVLFERRVGGLLGRGLFRSMVPMAGAAAVMGAVVWLAAVALERSVGSGHLGANVVTGLLPVLLGVALYALLTRLLRVGEAEALWSIVRQRRWRTGTEPKP